MSVGIEKPSPRWEMCVDLVQQFMGIATESMLSEQNPLETQTTNLANQIFFNIKNTVKRRLEKIKQTPDLYWHLKKKISNLSLQIGVADAITEESYLKSIYRMLIVQKANLFDSYMNGLNFMRKMEENRLKQPQMQNYITLNAIAKPPVASYSPSTNTIVIPRVLLGKPIFENAYPR